MVDDDDPRYEYAESATNDSSAKYVFCLFIAQWQLRLAFARAAYEMAKINFGDYGLVFVE